MALRLRVRCAQVRVFERVDEETGKPDPDRLASAATFVAVYEENEDATYCDGFQVIEPGAGGFEVGTEYSIEITKVIPANARRAS